MMKKESWKTVMYVALIFHWANKSHKILRCTVRMAHGSYTVRHNFHCQIWKWITCMLFKHVWFLWLTINWNVLGETEKVKKALFDWCLLCFGHVKCKCNNVIKNKKIIITVSSISAWHCPCFGQCLNKLL